MKVYVQNKTDVIMIAAVSYSNCYSTNTNALLPDCSADARGALECSGFRGVKRQNLIFWNKMVQVKVKQQGQK